MIPTKNENPSGLHQRYKVSKANPEDVSDDDKDAVYFVLRLDGRGNDPDHIRACRRAALTYSIHASEVDHLRPIAVELISLLESLETEPA